MMEIEGAWVLVYEHASLISISIYMRRRVLTSEVDHLYSLA